MATLYTYVIPHDNGAAPNPFGGVCTLVICKPVIRRVAEVGDWVVATGSADSPLGDIRGKVVYAMRVTGKMPMWAYDAYTQAHLPTKVPDWYSGDPARMVGDSIYDFFHDPPLIRRGVHGESSRERDLGGLHALLSEHFYYFGDRPRALPDHLRPIVKVGQSHRSASNAAYVEPFVAWLEGLGLKPNTMYGKPAGALFRSWEGPRPPKTYCGA